MKTGNRMFGWIGQILRADLSNGRIVEESMEEEAQRFLGGRGAAGTRRAAGPTRATLEDVGLTEIADEMGV